MTKCDEKMFRNIPTTMELYFNKRPRRAGRKYEYELDKYIKYEDGPQD